MIQFILSALGIRSRFEAELRKELRARGREPRSLHVSIRGGRLSMSWRWEPGGPETAIGLSRTTAASNGAKWAADLICADPAKRREMMRFAA